MSDQQRTKGGLVLARNVDESIHIIPGIEIRVNDVSPTKRQVKLWIKAPSWMNIFRAEAGRVPKSGVCKQSSDRFIDAISKRLGTNVEEWHQVHPDDLMEAILETVYAGTGDTPAAP